MTQCFDGVNGMFARAFLASVLGIAILSAADGLASPATVMGDLGEGMANQAWCGPSCSVVDTHHGRHGIDFLYYDTTDGEEKLHVAEVKSGGSQPNQSLKLSDDELELLRKQGIKPEQLPGGHYKVPQGTHAYNLVQMNRKVADFNKLNSSFETLKSGGNVSKNDAKRLAQHLESLKLPLTPYEEKLLRQAKDKGDMAMLKEVIKRKEAELNAAQQQASKLLKKAQADVVAKKYANELVRVTSKDGRFSIVSDTLDKQTGSPTGKQEVKDIHWKNYRESGPFRRLVKEQATQLCKGDRQCTERAYKRAMTQLEQNGNMHQAMQEMEGIAKSPASNQTSGSTTSNKQTTSSSKPKTAQSTSSSTDTSGKPQSTGNAAKLRKQPILTRVKTLISTRAGAAAGRLSSRVAPFLTAAASINPAVLSAVAVTGAVMAADAYIDGKFEAQTEELKKHFGEELKLVNENIGFIQQDIKVLGEQVDYKFALTLETLDRHNQAITGQLEDLDQQMMAGFTDLSATLLVVDQKQNYGIALQEAQFDDALHAGVKHYDVYLDTDDPNYLETAEREFTTAQSRYENLLNKQVDLAEKKANYRTQHALSSYYRTIAYSEKATTSPPFAEQAIKSFVSFMNQIKELDHLETVMPIVNYTYASILDLDGDNLASQRMLQAYGNIIDHYLALNQHNQAQAYSSMLTLIMDNDEARQLDDFVRYVTGTSESPSFDPWAMDERWIQYVEARESPKAGTIYGLLACSESQDAGVGLPDDCTLSTNALVEAAGKYDNETVHRYLIKSLLSANRVAEADQLLNKHYLSDANFRIRTQINIAYFKRNERGQTEVYCRLTNHVMNDTTFPDDLRQDVKRHRDRWGSSCSKSASSLQKGLRFSIGGVPRRPSIC
jgi:hypothetical protein